MTLLSSFPLMSRAVVALYASVEATGLGVLSLVPESDRVIPEVWLPALASAEAELVALAPADLDVYLAALAVGGEGDPAVVERCGAAEGVFFALTEIFGVSDRSLYASLTAGFVPR